MKELTINRKLLKDEGSEVAILLATIQSLDAEIKPTKESDFYFEATQQTIEELTGLSSYQWRKAMDTLEKLNLVDSKVMGLPAKKFVRLTSRVRSEYSDFITNFGK